MDSTNPICKQLSELLDAFHDGELHGQEHAQVEAHLKDCQACTGKLADIDRVTAMLKSAPVETPPAGFSARLDAAIDRQTKVVPMRRRAAWAAGAVAAVAVIAAGLQFAGPGHQAPVVANLPSTGNAGSHVEIATQKTPQPIIVKHQPEAPEIAVLPSTTSSVNTTSPSHEAVPTHHHPAAIAASESVQKHASNAASSNSAGTTHGGTEIASANQQGASVSKNNYNSAGIASASTVGSGANSAEIAELPVSTNSFNEAVGLSTDEDGLYDIKM